MEKVQKILTYSIFVVALIAVIFWVQLTLNEGASADDVTNFYVLTIIMLGITVGATLLASLIQLVTNPKQLKQAAVVLVIFGAIFGISYGLASDAAVVYLGETLTQSAMESKLVGASMYATYIIGALAIVSIVLAPIFKLIRK